MRNRIEHHLPHHEIIEINSSDLYIVDYKHINKGGVEISGNEPDVNFVHLANLNNVPVFFDGFPENGLPTIKPGVCCSQCECVIFPTTCSPDNENNDWILFIETKYVNSLENAFRENNNYPNIMIDQIIETVTYFRDHGIIPANRRVNAIVAFPTLINDFSESFFTGERTKEGILMDHRILIRATNSGNIISAKRIKI